MNQKPTGVESRLATQVVAKLSMRKLTRVFACVVIGALGFPGFMTLANASGDAWRLESGEIDPGHYFGETVANGMIGIVSAPVPFRTAQTLINGAYETLWPGYVSCIVSSFNFMDLSFAIDGERIERLDQVRHFRQTLDMRRAAFVTSFDYADKASVTYTLRALRHMPFTALLEITVEPKRAITIQATSLIQDPQPLSPHDRRQPLLDVQTFDTTVRSYMSEADSRAALKLHARSAKSSFRRHTVAAAQTFLFDEPYTSAPAVSQTERGLELTQNLTPGHVYRFGLVGSTLTSAHVEDPLTEAQHLTAFSAAVGLARLIARHEGEWQRLWRSDIVIDGDDVTQRDIHSMLYHLYSSVREDTTYSIAPAGLSRGPTGYLGHTYWDTELWMLPPLLALHPDLAHSLIEYRFQRLPAAKRRAVSHGFRGALFPWESAGSGDDDSPSSAIGGELQHHISADVAIAAWNYYRVTQDKEWLRETGYPLIKETADFWTSRVTRNGPGRYDITNVQAPDEYAENVDNDAFTNAAAKENLAIATTAAKVLGVAPNPDWRGVRDNIPILAFPDGVTREYATYNGETIKQVDVNLLSYPLHEITDPRAIQRDLEYYLPRYDNLKGPSYSKAAFVVLYERLGQQEKALEAFKAIYEPNLRPPFRTLAESAEGQNPYFMTTAGGALQALIYGFAGLEVTPNGLSQRRTKLPRAWKSITLTAIGPEGRTYRVN